jgi:glycine/D-amino acid oxidase-like deaminating enzyme
MALQQQAAARVNEPSPITPDLAAAAMRYQAFREIEAEHLARMANFDLSCEWTPEIRQIVFNAGDHVRQARDARLRFRSYVRAFVVTQRLAREPLSAVLRRTRALLQRLEDAGALRGDGGWLEVEVLAWAIEDYENAA